MFDDGSRRGVEDGITNQAAGLDGGILPAAISTGSLVDMVGV